jgi:hypothetical protein
MAAMRIPRRETSLHGYRLQMVLVEAAEAVEGDDADGDAAGAWCEKCESLEARFARPMGLNEILGKKIKQRIVV